MTTPTSETLSELARRYTAAWCSQDPSSVAAFFSPNGSLHVNDAAPAVGREAITNVARGFMTAFPDMQVLMDDLVVQGDRAVYRWTLVGTNTGPGGTGRRVRISGFEQWRIGADGTLRLTCEGGAPRARGVSPRPAATRPLPVLLRRSFVNDWLDRRAPERST